MVAAPRVVTAASRRSKPVPLTRLVLENFRSYVAGELRPSSALTVVAAPNGAGKTNLLEAIHTAITGRSQRATLEHELVRHGAEFARVVVEIAGGTAAGGATVELVLPGAAAPAGIRKRLTVNGVPRRPLSVGETARTVLFRPEEMLLLVGSPSERRRFLDGIVTLRDRRAGRDLAELGRILAQRNALLRAIRAEEAPLDSLGFWDEQLAQVGARVMVARLELVRELGERIGPLHAAVAPPGEAPGSVRLGYLDTLKDTWPQRAAPDERLPEADEVAAAFRLRIAETRPKEAWNGVSLVGPQRDDLRVELAGREVAAHASRGQQRTIILALKLAETDILGLDGPQPIVLLDDVFSELDPERAARLGDLLLERGQVLVTTTDASLPGPAGAASDAVWRIADGRLIPPAGNP
jgi:DNA replication and repair protein RecF